MPQIHLSWKAPGLSSQLVDAINLGPCRFSWPRPLLAMLLTVLLSGFLTPPPHAAASVAETNVTPDLSVLMPVWNPFYSVSVGVGYKDNVLLSHSDSKGSGFVGLSGDFTLWRRPIEDGREFQWVLNAVDRRYWNQDVINHEDWAFSRARYLHDLGPSWIWVSELDLSYFDVAVDLTYVESAPLGAQLRGGGVGGLSGIRHKWDSGDWVQISPAGSRTWLSGGFDAYSEWGGQVAFQHGYGNRSDWRADYSLKLRQYDHRRTVDLVGREVSTRGLTYLRHDMSWALHHYWDASRRWRTTTKLNGLASFDNGSGYLSYWRAAATEQLEYLARSWSLRLEVGMAYYSFPRQRLVLGSSTTRERADIVTAVRWERKLGRAWKFQMEYNWDGALANDPLEAYGANTFQGGLAVDF